LLLRQRGLYEASIVIFTADHGEMNGRRALVDKWVYLFLDVLRVPLAIKIPGVKPQTVEAPVSHLDLVPTLLEVAGVEALERLDGRSVMPYLRGTATPGDRELLFDCGWHLGVNFACAIQRWAPGGAQHLYT
jgi:arylsulfatase A-like enzyme